MKIIYDLIFLFLSSFYLGYCLLKGKSLEGFFSRCKFLSKDLAFNKGSIWIHAVSVGEVLSIKNLVENLKRRYRDKKIVITTITSTGNRLAKSIFKEEAIFYLPLDLSFLIDRFIKRLNPSLLILVETELWPNLISNLYQKRIPIVLINARLSPASFKGYLLIKLWISSLLNKIDIFCVQTETDYKRFLKLGLNPNKLKITGNMKFDLMKQFSESTQDYRKTLMLEPRDILLVAGSTHPGEEKIIIEVYKRLITQIKNLKLLIAPRHPERSKKIAELIGNFGFSSVFVSELPKDNSDYKVFILDTLGRLIDFYRIADIVFVGGSLVKKGGHNILEPAFFKKPIIFGPYMFNFKDISNQFLEKNASLVVRNKEELFQRIKELLENPQKCSSLGENAFKLILENQGATERNLKWIEYIFSGT
ncbi:MAG: 3-deoxy-D-manno-octulosonic acid transferase [Candidatus Omnitrophica bacterium]|nr:3-deoxy-D-manno-octulosonic acid transferase [Candidatus Omnitrophota bacterium]